MWPSGTVSQVWCFREVWMKFPHDVRDRVFFSQWAECHVFLILNLFSADIYCICQTPKQQKTLKKCCGPLISEYVMIWSTQPSFMSWLRRGKLRSSKTRLQRSRHTLYRREWTMSKREMSVERVNHPPFLLVASPLSFLLSVMKRYETRLR